MGKWPPNQPGDTPDSIPPKVLEALRRIENRKVFVPPAVDQAILRAARQQISTKDARRTPWLRRWVLWSGLATGCAAILLLVYGVADHRWPGQSPAPFAREDVNHDGRVDILDAYALARQLEDGKRPEPGLDVNGDGVVDRRDAEVIARRAVKLTPGGRS